MNSALQFCLPTILVTASVFLPVGATAMSISSELKLPGVMAQMRPFKPGFPPRPLARFASSGSSLVRLKMICRGPAGNMILPAILLGRQHPDMEPTASSFKLRANSPEGRKAISYQIVFAPQKPCLREVRLGRREA